MFIREMISCEYRFNNREISSFNYRKTFHKRCTQTVGLNFIVQETHVPIQTSIHLNTYRISLPIYIYVPQH